MSDTAFKEVPIGTSSVFTKTVSESDVYQYAGISGDFSPNHIDEEYMKGGRFGARVAHGTLLLGFMSAASARLYLGRTASMGYDRVRFIKPVFFGDTIHPVMEVLDKRDKAPGGVATIKETILNQRDEVVVSATIQIWMGVAA